MARAKISQLPLVALVGAALALGGCNVFKGRGAPTTPTVGTRVPILSNRSALEVDAATAAQAMILPPATVNADWAQSGGSATKSGGHLALGEQLGQAWTAQIAGGTNRARLAAPPVVAGGTLYVVDTNARVVAFDAATGARRWEVEISPEAGRNAAARFGGGVSVDGTTVYAVSGLGDVVALDAASGGKRWSKRPAGPLRGAPTVAFGSVYVITQDNQLVALSQTDGATQWQVAGAVTPGTVFGAASPAAGQGTVVAGYSSGELNAYRYENGRPLWADALALTAIAVSVSTLSDVDADPVIDNGRVFAIGQGGRMASYELVTGQRIWELSIGGISTPWVAGDWIWAVTGDAKLYAVSRATGRVRWVSELPRWRDAEDRKGAIRWTGPVLAGNRLILVSTDGRMAQVDPASGAVSSMTPVGGGSRLTPVVANSTLYLLDEAGRLTAWR